MRELYCLESGFVELPISLEHAIAVRDLEHHHKDPFDRLIIATTLLYQARLASVDGLFSRYPELTDSLLTLG